MSYLDKSQPREPEDQDSKPQAASTPPPARILPRAFPKGEHRGEEPKPQPQSPDTMLTREHERTAVDHEVRRALIEFKQKNGLSNKQLAKRLKASNHTIVSKYLNSTEGRQPPAGDWLKLQANARAMLRIADNRPQGTPEATTATQRSVSNLWHTHVTKAVFGVLEIIRQTNDFALVHGKAGIGKTSGLAMYVEENPTTAIITASERQKDARGLTQALMAAEQLTTIGRSSYAQAIEDRFRDSDRLLIVDNAQRLSKTALAWLFDFHDATGCAVALVGNPEVLNRIRKNDQFFSRVGLCEEVTIGDVAQAEEFALEMVKRGCPQGLNEFAAEATERILGKGHARTLFKQLNLTRVLLQTEQFKNQPRKAFAAAKTKLVTVEGGAR